MSELLAEAGRALWGPRWQTEMARALGVTSRTVRRWVEGASPVPAETWRALASVCWVRRAELAGIENRLRAPTGG